MQKKMQELETQQAELQTAETRYTEVKVWIDAFEDAIKKGNVETTSDMMLMKTPVERITVYDDEIEVTFKCGASIIQEYIK